eukprot:9962968-Ditylum_brightwellii.AAC.1
MEYAFKAASSSSSLTGKAVHGSNSCVVAIQIKVLDQLMDPTSVAHCRHCTGVHTECVHVTAGDGAFADWSA